MLMGRLLLDDRNDCIVSDGAAMGSGRVIMWLAQLAGWIRGVLSHCIYVYMIRSYDSLILYYRLVSVHFVLVCHSWCSGWSVSPHLDDGVP